jgi:hypothetical protein
MKKNQPRILGRRLAREISHAEIEQSRAGYVLPEQPQLPRLPGVETQTLIYPPDHDTLGGGVGV